MVAVAQSGGDDPIESQPTESAKSADDTEVQLIPQNVLQAASLADNEVEAFVYETIQKPYRPTVNGRSWQRGAHQCDDFHDAGFHPSAGIGCRCADEK